MTSYGEELASTFLSILQRGISEAESMVREGQTEMAADLLDALDNIPENVLRVTRESERQVKIQLESFDRRYPHHYTRYAQMLSERYCTFQHRHEGDSE